MAKLKQQETELLATDQGESAGGRVPPNTLASGNRPQGAPKPFGPQVPKLTSSSGDLGTGPTFSKDDPYKRRPASPGGR
jgi:hypothetical protein